MSSCSSVPLKVMQIMLTTEGLAVGLQLYLEKDFSLLPPIILMLFILSTSRGASIRNFVPVSFIKNIIDDIYPDSKPDMPLAYQMVEAGKNSMCSINCYRKPPIV